MLLLSLVLGWLAPAAEPGPTGPPDDLARVARLGAAPGREPAPRGASETAEYAVESAARGALSYVLPVGPRTIRALEVEPTAATADAWRLARLRLTWEDDDPWTPLAAVDLPVGLAFGRAEGLPPVDSVAVGTAGGAWVNRFPMPYRTGALLRISTDRPIEGRIRVQTTRGVTPDAGYFRGDERSAGSVSVSVSGTGRGQLAGVFAVTEGPAPSGPGRVVLDGKDGGSLAAALGIDPRRPSPRPGPGRVRGVLVSEGNAGRSAAYRWFLTAPLAFRESFVVEAGTGAAVAVFWYSEAPARRRGGR